MNDLLIEGFIGSGKGKAAKAVAKELGLTVVDIDRRIADRLKMTTAEIYDHFGEPYYRAMETLILSELITAKKRSVIVLGSGIPMMPQNRKYLKELGKVCYIRVKPETVIANMKASKKHGWIADEGWEDKVMGIYHERVPSYEEAADMIVDADGLTAAEIAALILAGEGVITETESDE